MFIMKLLFIVTNGFKLFNAKQVQQKFEKPSCINCKWFIPNDTIVSDDEKKRNDYGFCKMYKYTIEKPSKTRDQYEYAKHCRANESMCGNAGYLYEPAIISSVTRKDFSEVTQLIKEYNELENRFSGEIMEKDEIKETENEMRDLMVEIRKYFT